MARRFVGLGWRRHRPAGSASAGVGADAHAAALPALDEGHADEGDHRLALLVHPGVADATLDPSPAGCWKARVSMTSVE